MSREDRRPEQAAGHLKRSVMIAGHRTSVSLEAPFWDALRHLAEARGVWMQALIGEVDAGRSGQNLSSAIRVFVLRAVWPGETSAPG
ncbi:MAG: ribbon-helix-helix domain-containing protein [Methylobacterium frigidaeris]